MISLKVEGMTCGHCVKAVTKAVHTIEAAASVDIDLGAGLVRISSGDPERLASAIAEAGYAVRPTG
ncbi:MAG: heavy-metal-associated domain-containing protein [Alphaproteobacteria bacterium]|nr:heavy-metal-associated domain-containing protein [Alphaproteobacteria bacterium]MBU0798441.1 heavy-metal-associated domain-containing protein [Alphaproteobacteria bacterium]MBU1812565.1 heavy-metal-associated domain-containing protein [Alphaproteobacteria bacterium]